MRLPSGVPGFDEMLQGGFPTGASVVLQGPPGQEKLRFALTFLAEGLRSGASGLVVVSSQSPDSILAELRSLGVDLDSVVAENRLRIVDWYTQREEPVQDVEDRGAVIRSSIDLTNVGVALSRAIAALGGDQPRRAVVELLSPAMSVYEVGQVYAFAQSSKSKFVRFRYTALYLLEKEMHTAPQLTTLHQPFDGVIEIERTRVGDRIVRKIGVLHMKDTAADSAFHVLDDVGSGLRVVGPPASAKTAGLPARPVAQPGSTKATKPASVPSDDAPDRASLIVRIAHERLKLNATDPDALFAYAAAQGSLEDVASALEALERLAKIDDHYPGLWILKAKLHDRVGDAASARESRIRAKEAAERSEPSLVACLACGAAVEGRETHCSTCGADLSTDARIADELAALAHVAIQEGLDTPVSATAGETGRPPPSRPRKAAPTPTAPSSPPAADSKRPARTDGRRGLTNGLMRDSAPPRSVGKTNGLRGRTNGLTNGLRGRTNGLTNGLGRTNGLTNGLGRTNGLTNGLGRTNGVTNGLVNGLANLRRGLTNGLTNGSGFTNGLGSRRFQREARLNRWKLYLIPLVAVSLLVLSLAVPSDFGPSSLIQIDGSFEDWSSTPGLAFDVSGNDADIDLVRAAFVNESRTLSLLVAVRGTILAGSPSDGRMDAVYVMLDLDGNVGTGYSVRSLGADRLLEIQGHGGAVSRAIAYHASSAVPDRRDWRIWVDPAPIEAAASGARLEVQIDWLLLGEAQAPPAVFLAARSWDGAADYADYVIGPEPGHLVVVQQHVAPATYPGGDAPVLTLELEAMDADVRVSGITVDLLGTAPVSRAGRVRLLDESAAVLNEVVASGSRVPFTFSEALIRPGQPRLWTVTVAGSGSTGETLGAIVQDGRSINAAGALATIRTVTSPDRVGYLGPAPLVPIVDGAFAEWTADVVDAVGEPETFGSPSVDIGRFGAVVGGTNLSFHVRLQGPAFEGTVVPTAPGVVPSGTSPAADRDRDTVPDTSDLYPDDFNNDGVPDAQSGDDHDGDGALDYTFGGPDVWLNTTIPSGFPAPYAGRNVTVFIGPSTAPPALGEDRLRLYIDRDNNSATGFFVGGLGADYLVELEGREGLVASATASSHAVGAGSGEWRWTSPTPVTFAQSPMQVEAVASITIVVPSPSMYVEVSNWIGGRDFLTASANAPINLSPTLFVAPSPRFVSTRGGSYAHESSGSSLGVYLRETRTEAEEIVLRHGSLFAGWRTTGLGGTLGIVEPSEAWIRVAGRDAVLGGFGDAWEHYVVAGDRVKHNVWFSTAPASLGDEVLLQGALRITEGAVVYIDGRPWEGAFSTNESIAVEFEGQRIRFEAPFAYESRRPGTAVGGRFEGRVNGSLVSLSMAVPAAWFRAAERQYPVVLDPTGIIDTATTTPTGGPAQRNVFHDGSYFWAFYSDGSNTVYEPSSDGLSWVNTKANAFTTASILKPSVWFHDTGSTKIVYVVGDGAGNDATVAVRRGTISGTTITWGTEATATVGASNLASKTAFITRDSSGFLWISSSSKSGGGSNYQFSAVRSTNADDVSAWNAYTFLLDASISGTAVQGVIVPLGAGEVYGLWYADGAIDGKKYSGSWGSKETIDTTTTGSLSLAPSAVVDASSNIHLVYVDSAGAVKYRQRTGSWGAATTLDASAGNSYPTITRDTSSGDLYVFYVSSTNQIKAQQYTGSWSSLSVETNTNAKSALTSVYQIGHPARVSWTWSQGSASPFDVKFSHVGMGAMSVRQGTFVRKTDGTGNQAITGVGFQPKALILWYARVTDETHTANDYGGFGIATSSSQRYAIALGSDNGVGTTNTGKGSAAAVLRIFSAGTPTLDGAADLASFDTNGFTLTWTTNPNPAQATLIHYIAIGGPAVTNAYVGQFTGPSAGGTGNRAFTGVGFRGQFGLFLSTNQAVTGDASGESFSLGAAVSSSRRWVLAGGGNDGVTSVTHAETFVSASNVLASYATGASAAALTTDNVADFVSWDSDGFTLSYSKATTGSILFWGLILKGGDYDAGNLQVPNSGSPPFDQAVTGVGFRPKGVLFLGDNRDTFDTEGGNFERMIAAGSQIEGTVYESLVWSFNRNIVASDSDMRAKTTKAVGLYSSSGTTINEADFKQADADGFTLTHTTISAGTKRVLYWAFGDSSPVSRTVDTSTDSVSVKYNHQRKVFHDGSRFWVFYYDGSNTVYTSSVDGLTWENSVDRAFTTAAVGQASVWFHDTGSTKIVYAVGDGTLSDSTVAVRRGTISGGTITWGTQESATVSSSNTVPKIAFITRDTSGYVWIASSMKDTATTFSASAIRSTNVDDVSTWNSFTELLGGGIAVDFVFPTILPMAGGDMYALWYANGAINGREYTGSWGGVENIATTTAGVTTKIPSAVVDGSDTIHLLYIDGSDTVQYKQRTGSWGSSTGLTVSQFARPDSDIDTGTWSPTPIWQSVDDNSDADFVSATVVGTDEVGLSDVTDPQSSIGHIVRFRAQATGSGQAERLKVELYQGAVLIASSQAEAITEGSFNTYSFTLTASEADSITDYSNLRFRIIADTLGGGEQLDLSWVELQLPALGSPQSPTLTLESSTGNLYAFWIGLNDQIYGKKYSGSWNDVTGIDVSTIAKGYITSPYSTSTSIGWSIIWDQGGSSPWETKIAKIPEFEQVLIPIAGIAFLLYALRIVRSRRARTTRDQLDVPGVGGHGEATSADGGGLRRIA